MSRDPAAAPKREKDGGDNALKHCRLLLKEAGRPGRIVAGSRGQAIAPSLWAVRLLPDFRVRTRIVLFLTIMRTM
jgi:hypothetical protein